VTCERCGEDKMVTVLYGITLTRYVGPAGIERTERRERRLCVTCGAGLAPDEVSP
jgi:hypothetical protein